MSDTINVIEASIKSDQNNKDSENDSSIKNTSAITESKKEIEDSVSTIKSELSKEHQTIIEKENDILKKILLKQQEIDEDVDPSEDDNTPTMLSTALDLYMIIVKTYFLMLLNYGEMATKFVVDVFLPEAVANELYAGTFNMDNIIPVMKNVTNALKDKEFREHVGSFFSELNNIITPQMKTLLKSVFKTFIDVANKNSTKLVGIINTTISAFPPAALFLDIASIADVGVNSMKSGLELASISTNSLANIQNDIPSVLEKLENARKRLNEVGVDTSKLKETFENGKQQAINKIGLKDIDTTKIREQANAFGNTIKDAARSGAKGIVNLIHSTSITDDTYDAKKTELAALQNVEPKDQNAITELTKDIENYEKNKAIKKNINDKDNTIIDRTKNILNTEGINVDKEVEQIKSAEEKAKQMASSVFDNSKKIASSGVNFGKTFFNEIKHPTGSQQKQSGGSIKKIHNLSKKITSRIMKSLKDFSNTDRIHHRLKTKRRKLHKQTKKHRKYRK